MGDEISNAELARQLKHFREQLHKDVEELKRASAAYVLREVYASDSRTWEARVNALERLTEKLNESIESNRKSYEHDKVEERKRQEQTKLDQERERRNDRRIVLAAFLAAFLPLLIDLFRSTGSGP